MLSDMIETEQGARTDAAAGGMVHWDPQLYESSHSFVWEYGQDLVGLLSPKPGEYILDLGCGTGQLTAKIAESGARVLGIDNSPDMIEQARFNFPKLDFELRDATNFQFEERFDAVFSNAVLHWVKPAERAVHCIAEALRARGRVVAEFGGKGNVRLILAALRSALQALGVFVKRDPSPWYFPSIAEYATLLEEHGIIATFAALFDRPTPLDGELGMHKWIRMFGGSFLRLVPVEHRDEFLHMTEAALRPALCKEGVWFADYTRLRLIAVKDGQDK